MKSSAVFERDPVAKTLTCAKSVVGEFDGNLITGPMIRLVSFRTVTNWWLAEQTDSSWTFTLSPTDCVAFPRFADWKIVVTA